MIVLFGDIILYFLDFFPPRFLLDLFRQKTSKISDTLELPLGIKLNLVSVVIWSETILGKSNYSFLREMESNQLVLNDGRGIDGRTSKFSAGWVSY